MKRSGLTLIELLIVVAILAILSLIGTVNFLEAQTRSKVSRVKADHRAIEGALTAYHVDNGAYPPAAIGDVQLLRPLERLTHPVAYLSSIPRDPFGVATYDFNPGLAFWGYEYKDRETTSRGMPAETYGYIWEELPNKDYFLHSCGPNRVWNVSPFIDYDPTNGTVSAGDIIRFGPL